MSHIKEPKGVDFIIKSEPLSQEGREEISAFIKKYKKRTAVKTTSSKRATTSKSKSSHIK